MTTTTCPRGHVAALQPTGECVDCDHFYSRISVTGVIAAAPDYGPNAVVIFLDAPPEGRKFAAGERVTLRSGGQP